MYVESGNEVTYHCKNGSSVVYQRKCGSQVSYKHNLAITWPTSVNVVVKLSVLPAQRRQLGGSSNKGKILLRQKITCMILM